MAGPPAEMTPALATVIRQGRADQHTINTTLVELASSGRIELMNIENVRGMKSDDEPDPLTDPAIVVNRDDGRKPIGKPQNEAWDKIRQLAGESNSLSRERLWRLNSSLEPVKGALEYEAVRLGWLARMPGPSIAADDRHRHRHRSHRRRDRGPRHRHPDERRGPAGRALVSAESGRSRSVAP